MTESCRAVELLGSVFALAGVLAGVLAGALAGPAFAAPRTVATIKPVHSLVAGVMAGVGRPTLLLKGGRSPHLSMLKPSEARLLRRARLVFWVDPALETFMPRALAARRGRPGEVRLSASPGIRLLANRGGGRHDVDARGAFDVHVWLDPANAGAMTAAIERALAGADPANAARYAENAARLIGRLDALEGSLRRDLAPVSGRPFVVFHDAYRHFQARFGLNAVGALMRTPDVKPGARRVREMRATIASLGAVCVMAEPQFRPALVEAVVRGTAARVGELDPLGMAVPPGPDAYFGLMRGLAGSLRRCLSAGN